MANLLINFDNVKDRDEFLETLKFIGSENTILPVVVNRSDHVYSDGEWDIAKTEQNVQNRVKTLINHVVKHCKIPNE